MTSITTAGSSLLATTTASRLAASTPAIAALPLAAEATPLPSTLLTLANAALDNATNDMLNVVNEVVYAKPLAPTRAWAVDPQDDISSLMTRNRDRASVGNLAEQWRGLGGALLSQLAATGTGYRQAMVDYTIGPGIERTKALDSLPQSGVENGAASVSLKIKTRSGQSVELKILVNTGATGGNRGLQVAVSSSGPLSSAERKALADLAEGFDQALEGLGQNDKSGKLKLDLAKLMDYDSRALASVDLTVQNPQADQALSSFSLRLAVDQKTLAFKGTAGDIALNLDTDMPFGLGAPSAMTNAQQRQAVIAEHLQKFDAAADRSHADASLLALFKDAFTQLHSAPSGQGSAQADTSNHVVTRQVQPLLSGLADFQASFGGDSEKTNDLGFVKEIGRADYQLSQKTTAKRTSDAGDIAVTQTQSEQLDAHYLSSRSGGMLDTSSGNYDITKISDHSSTSTMIETADKALTHALKTVQQQQLKTVEKLVNHRVAEQHSTPVNHYFEQLLH